MGAIRDTLNRRERIQSINLGGDEKKTDVKPEAARVHVPEPFEVKEEVLCRFIPHEYKGYESKPDSREIQQQKELLETAHKLREEKIKY